jgi:hypothetical protein
MTKTDRTQDLPQAQHEDVFSGRVTLTASELSWLRSAIVELYESGKYHGPGDRREMCRRVTERVLGVMRLESIALPDGRQLAVASAGQAGPPCDIVGESGVMAPAPLVPAVAVAPAASLVRDEVTKRECGYCGGRGRTSHCDCVGGKWTETCRQCHGYGKVTCL